MTLHLQRTMHDRMDRIMASYREDRKRERALHLGIGIVIGMVGSALVIAAIQFF